MSFLCVLSLAIQNHRSINLTLGTNVCVSQVFLSPASPGVTEVVPQVVPSNRRVLTGWLSGCLYSRFPRQPKLLLQGGMALGALSAFFYVPRLPRRSRCVLTSRGG